ncbi:energy transducer TonB [Pyxidicoccus sp. 3LG]
MRVPFLLTLFVVPVLACELEERPAPSDRGAARKPVADTRPPASTDTDAGLDLGEHAQAFFDQPPNSIDVLPFGAGMTRPERIQGELPGYTPEALAARVEGIIIIKCVVQVTGEATRCRILQPLPHLDAAFLNALKASRFKPATYKGHPVPVDYTFTFEMKLPKENR